MEIKDIKNLLNSSDYSFLKDNPHLNEKVVLLALGGSYAYGTNVATSDIDIRGCALNSRQDLLGLSNFEQFVDEKTDTVIYSFNKLVRLLIGCNPNVIEMLGCKPEHYLYLSPIGQELVNNRHMFLSQRAVKSFGGFATQQLRKLENSLKNDDLSARLNDSAHLNKHAMHLIRLYLMCLDILEKGEINTYRYDERELLLNIRNGYFQNEESSYNPEFFELVADYEKKFDYAKRHTDLPQHPDMSKIEEFVISVNEKAAKL